jgi:3-ketoacyl-CoA synthase
MSSEQPEPTATAAASSKSATTNTSMIKNAWHRTSTLKQGYHLVISNALYPLLAPAIAYAFHRLSHHTPSDLTTATHSATTANPPLTIFLLVLFVVLSIAYLMRRPHVVYLLNLACYKPGPEHVVTQERFLWQSEMVGVFTPDNLAFQWKILERSVIGQGTFFPSAVLNAPPNPCMAEARVEAKAVMFGTIYQVLAKTGIRARDIGVYWSTTACLTRWRCRSLP